ncbi:MAG TPA: YHYH protein [Candidatus Saccharimonadales bacterium]|nr:YHYH protein [Candidatus Saccharimonadales bacterium]
MKKNPQKISKNGFAVSAAIILLLLLAAFIGTAYYVWKKGMHDDSALINSNVPAATAAQDNSATTKVDLTKLPLGDGKVTTSGAKKGYVFSCTDNFRGGGAMHSGGWISGSTWNLEAKPTVEGSVDWPNAKVAITKQGDKRIISGNGLPVDTMTGIFPIKAGTDAYAYDRNPNSIQAQTVLASLPANPAAASMPTCVGLGEIGYMTNGVALFNALDAAGRDAAAHEVQDKCDGHPQMQGIYHYHSLSTCLEKNEGNNQLLGYALDGFGIYGNKDSSGNIITNSQLDECHGMTSKIQWDGKTVNMYHYVINHEYPYSIACFRGAPVQTKR